MCLQNYKQLTCIYTVEGYLDDISSDKTYNYGFMIKIRTAIRGYMTFHRFNKDEYENVMKIADTSFMKKMTEVKIDRTIFALQMLYLYITNIDKKCRANLNISDRKLLNAKTELIMDLLKLKKKDIESYNKIKDIIDDSIESANKYFNFVMEFEID